MDMKSMLDPELVEPLEGIMAATGGGFNLRDIPGTRAMVAGMLAAMKAELPPVEGVASEDIVATVAGAETAVPVRMYRPTGVAGPLPALLWMHPGGYVIGSIEMDDFMARLIVKEIGCVMVSVEYRLAPEHPFPAPLEDCYTALQWLGTNAAKLGVDPNRIAVGGASAGGGLAAGLALLARDRKAVRPCLQLLIYPAINDYNVEQTSETTPENLFWSRENMLIGWQEYLSNRQGSVGVSPYAAAYRATDLTGLPPAYIAVGALDMFVPDCLNYAERLIAAGVPTGLHVYPGAFHAFDAFAPMAQVSQRFVADRNAALQRAFAKG